MAQDPLRVCDEITELDANPRCREYAMSEAQPEQKNGRIITTYIPVFRDKLAKLEKRGLGHCEEAQRLRNTIMPVESKLSPPEADKGDRRFLFAAE